MTDPPGSRYVSRGGLKLAHALTCFQFDVRGWICADLGSHVGGFVDCLLQAGAARVYSIDTSYGTLAWKLRRDPRVVVRERCNALHAQLPEPVRLVTIDVGWTRQDKILPAAAALLGAGGDIITLVKPHYEAGPAQLTAGVLPDDRIEPVVAAVTATAQKIGLHPRGRTWSPITGHGGNREVLLWLERPAQPPGVVLPA